MRKLYCPKCRTVQLVNAAIGAHSHICPSCGEQINYTLSQSKSVCSCPACSKNLDVSLGNWLINEGEVLDSFDSLTGWSRLNGTGSFALDLINYRTSNASLKITNVAPDGDTFLIKDVNWDLSDLKTLSMWVYVYQTQALQKDIVRVALSTTANWSKYVEKTWVYLRPGWNCLAVTKDELTVYGDEDLANPVIKIRIGAYSGSGSTLIVSFDELRYNTISQPICLITTDDGRKNQYTGMLPVLQDLELEHGILLPVTLYLCKLHADLGEGGNPLYLTYAQIQALHDAGWLIANHSLTHPYLTSSTDSEIAAEIIGMADWLISKGWDKAPYHFAYPYGAGSPDIYDVMAQCGILSARIVSGGLWQPQAFFPYKVLAHTSLGLNYMGVADAKAKLLQVATYGGVCIFTLHGVSEIPTNEEYTPAEFREVMEYGIELGVIFLTAKQLYDGLNLWDS